MTDFGDRYPVPDENEPQPRPYKSPGQVAAMSDAQLADHIEAGTHDDDGTSFSVRIALARILRRTAFAAPAVTSTERPTNRDWIEDAQHENGNYECRCCECDHMFVGHKRRVLCKACSNLLRPSAVSRPDGGGPA